MITYDVNLCIGIDSIGKKAVIKCHDTGVNLRVWLSVLKKKTWREETEPYIIPDGSTAVLKIAKPDNTFVLIDGEITGGYIFFEELPHQTFTAVGIAKSEVSLFDANGRRLTTATFEIEVPEECVCDCKEESKTYVDIMSNQIQAAIDAEANAKASAESAEEAASVAVAVQTNPPKIGENGNWQIWDAGLGMYVDAGISAQGKDGENGKDGSDAEVTAENIKNALGYTPGRKVTFSVADYGAVADGVTDDSTAIQAAVDACNAAGGGTVFFPKGTYLIGTAITAYGNQHFIGEHGAVLLLAANSATGFMIADTVSNLVVEDLTFDAGEGQQAKTDLIPVTGSADVTFKNCDFVHGFENLNQGLAFVLANESSNFQMQNCRFAPDANDGVTAPSKSTACVAAKATDRVIVKDCLFDHADVAMNADAYSTDILAISNVVLDSYIGFNVNDGKQGITCLAINNVMNGKFENLYTFATVVGQGNRVNLCKYAADEPDPTDTAFFDLSSTGALSLKPEYRGAAPDNSYTYAVSDQGVGKEGSLILSLPERIVLPRLIGGKTVMSYQQGMFCGNSRVKEIVVLDLVKAIPAGFCDGAKNLRAVENTNRTTTVGANAFRDTRIGQALFPKLASTGLGANAFQRCMYLEVADLGTTLTKIPDYCFANCLNLKLIKNGTKVTSLGAYAFRGAFSLKALPFMNKLTSLGNYACFNSRIQNWSELKSTATLGSFATPIADNRTDYWTGSTFAACETPLTTALNQRNPKWVSKKVGNMTFDYTEGCGMLAMMHVHSALSGRQYNTPQEFELELKAIDPSLLNRSPTSPENYPTIMEALGYTATKITTTIDQNILNELYAALAEGGCAIIGMSGSGTTDRDGDGVPDSIQNGNHAVIIYGVNEDGEVMVLDSDTGAHLFEAYEDRRLLTYQVPFQNITGTNTKITIVEKKS